MIWILVTIVAVNALGCYGVYLMAKSTQVRKPRAPDRPRGVVRDEG